MKKIITCTVMLAFSATSFCQQNVQKQSLAKTDYLQKSKKQKTVAWVLLGGGATLVLTGIIIPKGDLVQEASKKNCKRASRFLLVMKSPHNLLGSSSISYRSSKQFLLNLGPG